MNRFTEHNEMKEARVFVRLKACRHRQNPFDSPVEGKWLGVVFYLEFFV